MPTSRKKRRLCRKATAKSCRPDEAVNDRCQRQFADVAGAARINTVVGNHGSARLRPQTPLWMPGKVSWRKAATPPPKNGDPPERQGSSSMIVIQMTDCPVGLRGDLTKWLLEISAGVFVGQVSARVRAQLWERIQKNAGQGRVIMVYSANNEQGLDFRVHHSSWQPIDFDGMKLMLRPAPGKAKPGIALRPGFSKAAGQLAARRAAKKRDAKAPHSGYIVIDLETTGLSPAQHQIIEYGAARVAGNKIIETFSVLVHPTQHIPPGVEKLTGLTDALLQQQGLPEPEALTRFLAFIGSERLIGHNISFDLEFLRQACLKQNIPMPTNACIDTLPLARRALPTLLDHRLETLSTHFKTIPPTHRSLPDCKALHQIYQNLINLANPT